MLKNWTRNPYGKGARAPWVPPEAVEELPPGVIAARARLGWPSKSEESARSRTPDRSRDRSPLKGTIACQVISASEVCQLKKSEKFQFEECRLVLHSGEVLTKTRQDAPWTPTVGRSGARRGQLHLAREISKDDRKRQEALQAYDALVFAAGTNLSKESLFSTWCKISRARGEEPLPLDPEKIRLNVAILRCSGYRAVKSYVYEARDRHVRAGFPVSPQLNVAVQDAKRVAERALGPVQRAEEVKPAWWNGFMEEHGVMVEDNEASQETPNAGLLTWVVGTPFVLREVELRGLTLDARCVQLETKDKVVTLSLPVSKSDPGGRGAKRSLGCTCKGRNDFFCPFHVVERIVQEQSCRLHVNDRGGLTDKLPLIGQRGDPRYFVDKRTMVTEAQRHVELMQDVGFAKECDRTRITGHFMRRSGIKEMARNGCTFSSIQWFARHSSQVTWAYIEEAWSETPAHALKLKDEIELAESVAFLLRKVNRLEEAEDMRADEVKQGLQNDGLWFDSEDARRAIREEARKALSPKFIVNVNSQTIHAPCHRMAVNTDPRKWTTKCGWPWVSGDCPCTLIYDGDTVNPALKKCRKCVDT